ncbi:unnamed protein product, partial [Ectocarpus sp. 13 AM-2016]
ESNPILFFYPPEVSARNRVAVSASDEQRTEERKWLNDNLIDLYVRFVGMNRSVWDFYQLVYPHAAFLTKFLMFAAHSGVKRWSRHVDLFSMKFVMVPVAVDKQWSRAYATWTSSRYGIYGGIGILCLTMSC